MEIELPSKTENMDVWCDGGNGEDSGVEVVRAASCGSSVLSGFSEPEAVSECGSDTYNTVKALTAQLNQQLDMNETWSESSSTHDGQICNNRPTVRTKKPASIETRVKDNRARVSARSDTKPKIPAKPTTIKPSPRPRKSEPVKQKTSENDGRWPFSAQKPSRSRATSAADPGRKSGPASLTPFSNGPIRDQAISNGLITSQAFSNALMSSSFGPTSLHKSMTQSFGGSIMDTRSSTLDKYGTLPRRKKKEVCSETSPVMTRSGSREPSLNRAATLRRQTSREKESPSNKSLPPYPRGRRPPAPKTLIVHEIAVQTALTARDLDGTIVAKGSGEVADNFAQTEETISAERIENLVRVSIEHTYVLERIRKLLGLDATRELGVALLDELERHVSGIARTVIKQREELYELHTFKVIAQRDLEKSLAAQKSLLQQQQQLESEHAELQDFLQAEKSTLSESLVDADDEISRLKEQLRLKEEELKEQQDQCKHLVRQSEQRRQENLSLEARLAGLEQRSHDVLRQQGAAVSGASVALTSLGARLDSLVDQLAVSYHVSDKDLEDVIFHNEVYSPDGSPDIPFGTQPPSLTSNESAKETIKPSRRGSSFLSAVLGAIRSATQSHSPSPAQSRRRSSAPVSPPDPSSESLGLLDSELTLDQLSKSSDGDYSNADADRSMSLQNLSAAILNRQRTEQAEEAYRSLDTGMPSDLSSLVDQVIFVDNLVTKLLKVMRIVQIDNDSCLDQIVDERADLDERLRVESSFRQESEERLQRMESELQEARAQLNARIQQLEDAKKLLSDTWRRESQRQYATIDNALETLQGMQDVVDQCPPLAKLQQQLEDCNFRTAAGDDMNANSPNGNVDNTELTNSCTVRTTPI